MKKLTYFIHLICHSRADGDPVKQKNASFITWIPAFAGMTWRNISKTVIIVTLIFLASNGPAYAQSPAPTSNDESVLSEKLNKEINNLKEKIASRVSELNLVEKRGIIGTVTAVSGNQITISDLAGKARFIDVDEITKFSSASNKSYGLSDLTKGTKITSLGLYNKQSKRLLARFINTSVDPVYVSGSVGDVDTKNFTLTILTTDQKQTKIDNQNTTKIFTYIKDSGFTKLGFSKIAVGERAFVMGYPDKTDPSLIVADRIIVLPALSAQQTAPGTQTVSPAIGR